MIDPSKFVIINKSNYRQYAATGMGGLHPNEDLADFLKGSRGYEGWQRPDRPHVFCGPKPVSELVPRSEWPDRIKAGQGSEIYDALVANKIKSKDQNGLNYCWVFGSVRALELCRVLEGLPHVELSPESVGGPATNWRNVGGYASEAFDQIQNYGACEASYLDKPCSLKPNRWKTGWEANAKTHEVVDWYNVDGSDGPMFEEVVTCLLNKKPIAAGLGWWGHLVAFVGVVLLPDGTVGILMQNSWLQGDWPRKGDNGLAILTESLATPDGAAAPIITIDAPVNPPPPAPVVPLPKPYDPSLGETMGSEPPLLVTIRARSITFRIDQD